MENIHRERVREKRRRRKRRIGGSRKRSRKRSRNRKRKRKDIYLLENEYGMDITYIYFSSYDYTIFTIKQRKKKNIKNSSKGYNIQSSICFYSRSLHLLKIMTICYKSSLATIFLLCSSFIFYIVNNIPFPVLFLNIFSYFFNIIFSSSIECTDFGS